MKSFRLMPLIYLIVTFGLVFSEVPNNVLATQQGQPGIENICFSWAFGAKEGTHSNYELISITRDTTLKTGDQFKMLVELKTKCFVYLIYHGSKGELYLLFPYNTRQFVNGYKTLNKYYIPQGNQWFTLDKNVGREIFYLLASARRLNKLESLFGQYEAVQPTQKEELQQKILAEIRNLRWQNRNFKEYAERPGVTMGPLRGIKKVNKPESSDIKDLAVEISAQDFYSRTFTIDHQ